MLSVIVLTVPTMNAAGHETDLAGWGVGGRKLIAVVYADMVGYSRLIGLMMPEHCTVFTCYGVR